jgi:hypothetical protein
VPSDTALPYRAWSPGAGATGPLGSLLKLAAAGFAKLAVCLRTAFLAFWLFGVVSGQRVGKGEVPLGVVNAHGMAISRRMKKSRPPWPLRRLSHSGASP